MLSDDHSALEDARFTGEQAGPTGALTDGLRHSTIALALFDKSLRCRAANPAFAAMNGMTDRQCIGKTMGEIAGAFIPRFEAALQKVWESGDCLWEQRMKARPFGGRRSKHWLVDFFPIYEDGGAVQMAGATFSQVTPRGKIQGRLLRISGLSALDGENGLPSRSARGPSMLRRGYIESMEQTVALLSRSMALRRVVSETHVAADLREAVAQQAAGDLRAALNLLERLQVPQATTQSGARASRQESWCEFNRPSRRELQVLRFLADGKSNKEMASALRLSIRTVETYRARLMSKLKVHSAAEIVRCAIRNHFIQA